MRPNDEVQDLKARILQDLEEQTIGLDSDILISSFKHLLKEKKVNLTFQNKMLEEDGRTLNDYNIQKDSPILMTSRLPGGAKRARAPMASKEDKMSGLSEEVAAKTMLLSTPAYSCAETQLAISHINLIQTSLAEDPKTVVNKMLATLNPEQLTTLSESLGNNNFDHKTEMLAKAVFEYDYQQAKHRLNSIAKMKEALLATAR